MQVFSKTLHRKILILILFIGIVPAIAGIIQVYWGSMIAVNSVIGEYCETQTARLAQDIGNLLEDKSKALLVIKKQPDFLFLFEASVDFQSEGFGKRNTSAAFFQNLIKETPLQNDYMYLATLSGDILAASNPDKSENFSNQKWWQDVAKLNADKVYLAETYVSSSDEKIKIIMATPVYLYARETSLGILYIVMNREKLLEKIETIQAGEGIFFTLYSLAGHFLYNHAENSRLQPILNENISLIIKKLGGYFLSKNTGVGKNIIIFSHIKQVKMWNKEGRSNCEWIAISKFETSRIVTFVNMLLWRMSFFGGVIIILICILGLLLSHRIVRPLTDLRKAALQLAEGNLDYKVTVATNDELQLLADTFNEMAERLKITYDDLAIKLLEIDEKARQIALIHEITKAINAALDLEKIFSILAEEIDKVVFYDRLTIAFIDEKDPKMIRFDFIAPEDSSVHFKGQMLPIEQTKYAECITSKEPILICDIDGENLSPHNEHLLYEKIQSCLIIPILTQSTPIGFFALASKTPNSYDENDKETLKQIAEALAVAVEHSHLYNRISKFAEELEEKIKERTKELENAQMKLVQTEKLAATGKLAANLAHEINNPLGIMKNYVRMISDTIRFNPVLSKDNSGKTLIENISVVKEELDRIARIVSNLLNFYKAPDTQKINVDINSEIDQLVNLMKNVFDKRGIKLELILDRNLPQILVPQDAMRQILLNLFRNAEDAMENGGALTVSTSLQKSEFASNNKSNIILSVKDTGCGIPYHHLNKIFDPFFTTKKEKGTGLGLSVTYGLVQSIGGTIEVDSILKRGTTFKITIPVENEKA